MESSNILSWTFAYDFIRGPMVWVAFIVFILGTVFQIFKFFSMSRKTEAIQLKAGPGNFIKPLPKDAPPPKTDWLMWLKLSVFGTNPFLMIVTTIFHLLLVLTPLFVLGHNILWDNAFGISMVSLPEGFTDFLTLIVIICALIFLYRRLFLDRVRAITTWADYLFLFLAAAPFITGYLAYHQMLLDYRLVITLHILFGEIMLMAVPFTKFVHMIYLVLVRFTISSEWGLGKGSRTW